MKHIFKGLVLGAVLILSPAAKAGNPELPLDLQSADDFVILAKSGISTVPPSDITGDMGVSPITSTAITGFALIMDASGEFSTSSQVTGKIYAPDYASPTPVKMTAAISDMETAYTNAAGRTLPDTNNLGATAGGDKDIGGLTFVPGLHKWTTGVLVSANVTLDASGNPNAVFIFQIEGDLNIASGQRVVLAGGAQAKNIFWQVAGGAGAIIGTTAHFEGVLLTANAINVLTGASFNGKLLAQKDVNLQQNSIVDSSLINQYTLTYTAGLGGSVLGDSPQTVLEGEDGTMVTAVADPGFEFTGWTGTHPSTDNPRTDLNVMSDITVQAQFQAIEYTLTYTAGLGGSVLGDSPQTVLAGEDGTMVTAVADPGFVFIGWTGTHPSLGNPRTDLNVMSDITVEAQFRELAPNQYVFTYTAGTGGSITGVPIQIVEQGNDGTMVTAVPDPGFTFVGWVGTHPSLVNPRRDLNAMSDITVEAQFQATEYTLTYTAGPGGSVLGVSPQTVSAGEDGTMVTAVADPGFVFIGWTGTHPSLGNPRTDLNVMSDITVEAQFQATEYTLTYTAGLGGSVLGDSPQTVLEGEDGTMVTAVADPGFVFIGWTGTHPSLGNPRTDLNVMSDITVEAQFSTIPTAPEIVVEQPVGVDVPDGGGRDFGPVLVGGTKDLVFTVSNSGNANLDLTLPITFSGPDAAMFTVTAPPMTTVLPGGSTTFTVRFAPLTAGAKVAALQLANNDSNENPFDINLSGLGSGLSVVSASPITLNPQTGLLEQTVRVTNNDLLTVTAVRLLVNGLPADVQVYNPSGSVGGIPYLQHDFPLAQGEEIVFLIEYYRLSRRSDFTPVFSVESALPVSPPTPAGEVVSINREPANLGGRILLEFTTIPSRRYVVQYSSDMINWKTTDPIITAPSNRFQWYDDGPPKTESKPDPISVPSRFYRIIQLP